MVFSLSTTTRLARPRCCDRDVLELEPELLGDHLAARQDGDVLQHGLAAIAEAGRLDGTHLEHAAKPVHDQRRQRFAFDVLGNDQHGLPDLAICSRTGSKVLQDADLLVVEQHERIFEDRLHASRRR